MAGTTITRLPERVLQRGVLKLFADPARLWTSTDGTQFHVVAAGTQNPHEGPDISNIAILLDGKVVIGDAEFHVRSSEWDAHEHSLDPRYDDLLLHVVCEDDRPKTPRATHTLVIDEEEVHRYAVRSPKKKASNELDELQHFALLRLMRHTAHAHSLIRRIGVGGAFTAGIAEFLERLRRKRRRPTRPMSVHDLIAKAERSPMADVVRSLPRILPTDLLSRIEAAEKASITIEGNHMRRELFVNAILPQLCVQATLEQRVVLFQWYWSAPCPHTYAHLRRRFPNQPQERVWQQQGMLEYLRDHGGRSGACGEIIRRYGLHNTIDFLQASPLP